MKKAILIILLLFMLATLAAWLFLNRNVNNNNANKKEQLTIEQLMDLRRVDGIVEPVYTQDCFPRTLQEMGVTTDCFERLNLGDDSSCTQEQIKMVEDYYKKGQDKDPLNDGSGHFCADE